MSLSEVITIDGPAGAGKTTVARLLAQKLGWALLESGSLYRTFTWLCLQDVALLEDLSEEKMVKKLQEGLFLLEIKTDPQGIKVFYGGREITSELTHPTVENKVSEVAALPRIRSLANHILRDLAQREKRIVAEGRDMGSVVFPEAKLKVFLTASPEIRAERRHKEWQAKGQRISWEEVRSQIMRRDQKDSSRQVAPLTVPEGALIIDTSFLSPEKVVKQIFEILNAKLSNFPKKK